MDETEEANDRSPSSGSEENAAEALPAYSEDGVDLTLIRWMLSLTPAQRLQQVQQYARFVMKVRRELP